MHTRDRAQFQHSVSLARSANRLGIYWRPFNAAIAALWHDRSRAHLAAARLAKTAALGLALTLGGCSTIMTDRVYDVTISSTPPGAEYVIADQTGQAVSWGVTPAVEKLDAAAGYFDGQTYTVTYNGGPRVTLDSKVTGWYWLGLVLSLTSGLIVDPLTGDMFELPDSVHADLPGPGAQLGSAE